MEQPVQPNPPIQIAPPKPASTAKRGEPFWKTPRFLLVILGILALSLASFFILNRSKSSVIPPAQKPVGVIVKVGEEFLYQSDLQTELNAYPTSSDSAKIKDTLTQKLITDSIILQGGLTDKIASLSATIFNSPNKDYAKRVKTIADIKKNFEDKYNLSGAFVAIWFDNNRPNTKYDERDKPIAFAKISKLQLAVKSNQMTIKEAGEAIRKDSSLAKIDPSYKANAYFEFSVSPGQKITFNENMDKVLRGLKIGEVSDVILLQDHQLITKKLIDAVYMFGTVTKKSGDSISFDDWLSQKRKIYEVKIY